MSLVSELVFNHRKLKVTLQGTYPKQGKLRELVLVDYVGHPLFTIDLEAEEYPKVINRNVYFNILTSIFKELKLQMPDVDIDYRHAWGYILGQLGRTGDKKAMACKVDHYLKGLRHDYANNKDFTIKEKTAAVMLFQPLIGDDKFRLSFVVHRPQHYSVHCNIACRHNGVVKQIAYSRTFPVEHLDYLLAQCDEWILNAYHCHSLNNKRIEVMRRQMTIGFNKHRDLIQHLVTNLNEGNNL